MYLRVWSGYNKSLIVKILVLENIKVRFFGTGLWQLNIDINQVVIFSCFKEYKHNQSSILKSDLHKLNHVRKGNSSDKDRN